MRAVLVFAVWPVLAALEFNVIFRAGVRAIAERALRVMPTTKGTATPAAELETNVDATANLKNGTVKVHVTPRGDQPIGTTRTREK